MNRQQALNQLRLMQAWHEDFGDGPCPDHDAICYAINIIEAQPEELDTLIKALEEEYAKAVRNWLVNYQVKCAELQGRYTPYEVLGWIVSDWRKDNGIW